MTQPTSRIRFRVRTTDLVRALSHVVIAKAQRTRMGVRSGLLFVVRGTQCVVCSRAASGLSAWASFPVTDAHGEGAFVVPAERIEPLRKHIGDWRVFEAKSTDEGRFVIRTTGSAGASSEYETFAPDMDVSCVDDVDLQGIGHEVPSAVLAEALHLAEPFIARANDRRTEPQYQVVQVFDASLPEHAKGDGHLFASDSLRAYYFWCEAFQGRGIRLHRNHVKAVVAFLKTCRKVTLNVGTSHTYATSADGRGLAWPDATASHAQFKYYSLKNDAVLMIEREALVTALRWVRATLPKHQDKIQVSFERKAMQLRFAIRESYVRAESWPIPVVPKMVDGEPRVEDRDWSFNIDHLIDLVRDVKNHEVELHVLIVPPQGDRKEVAMLRTIDDFSLDARGRLTNNANGSFKCRVTRLLPSKG